MFKINEILFFRRIHFAIKAFVPLFTENDAFILASTLAFVFVTKI